MKEMLEEWCFCFCYHVNGISLFGEGFQHQNERIGACCLQFPFLTSEHSSATVVRLLGGRRVAPSAWMSSATTLTLGPVQCQNKTLNLFLNIRRRHTIKIYLLVIDSAKLWDGLWTNYCRLIFHRCTKHGAVTWSQWVARKKCLEIGIILLEKNEKQPQISYIYSTSFLRSLFRRLQSSGKPMLRIACPRCQHRWCLPKPSEDSVAPE